jgi:putative ABC transport system permease protein
MGHNAAMLALWLGAFDENLAYAGLAIGVYLTLRVLNFSDITVDGSFALGGGVAAVLNSQNLAPFLAERRRCAAFAPASLFGVHPSASDRQRYQALLQ